MTAKYRFLLNIDETLGEIIYKEKNEAERKRIKEHAAFVKDEAIRLMGRRFKASITIQKHWRGYIGRNRFKFNLLKYFRQMSLNHYNSMATIIQKVWRGTWIRKHVYNYYKRKEYFQALARKNAKILAQLQEFREERQRKEFEMARTIQKHHQTELVRRYHHLVSTKNIPGVYNNPYRPGNSRDRFLKSVKFDRIPFAKKRKQFDNRAEKILDSIKNCPNVPSKQQGPFLDPKDVQLQRYKPIRQTLRMETDFYHLEKARKKMKDYEWTQRHHDDLFLPVINRHPKHKASMNGLSVYVPLGRVSYREEDPSLNVDKAEDFRLVLTPIPLFDVFEDKIEELKSEKLIKLT